MNEPLTRQDVRAKLERADVVLIAKRVNSRKKTGLTRHDVRNFFNELTDNPKAPGTGKLIMQEAVSILASRARQKRQVCETIIAVSLEVEAMAGRPLAI
jgi:hypothetical protein